MDQETTPLVGALEEHLDRSEPLAAAGDEQAPHLRYDPTKGGSQAHARALVAQVARQGLALLPCGVRRSRSVSFGFGQSRLCRGQFLPQLTQYLGQQLGVVAFYELGLDLADPCPEFLNSGFRGR